MSELWGHLRHAIGMGNCFFNSQPDRMDLFPPLVIAFIPTVGLALGACIMACLSRQEVADQRREFHALMQRLNQPTVAYYPPPMQPSAPPGPVYSQLV
jgi:hypothetical protein